MSAQVRLQSSKAQHALDRAEDKRDDLRACSEAPLSEMPKYTMHPRRSVREYAEDRAAGIDTKWTDYL